MIQIQNKTITVNTEKVIWISEIFISKATNIYEFKFSVNKQLSGDQNFFKIKMIDFATLWQLRLWHKKGSYEERLKTKRTRM